MTKTKFLDWSATWERPRRWSHCPTPLIVRCCFSGHSPAPAYLGAIHLTDMFSPALDGHSSLVLDYKSALAKYFPGEAPDYVSLEGYVAANVLIAALKRNGPQLDTESLVETLENLHDLDIGLGTPVTFSRSEHQGIHKVWGSQLDSTGHYRPIDLQ